DQFFERANVSPFRGSDQARFISIIRIICCSMFHAAPPKITVNRASVFAVETRYTAMRSSCVTRSNELSRFAVGFGLRQTISSFIAPPVSLFQASTRVLIALDVRCRIFRLTRCLHALPQKCEQLLARMKSQLFTRVDLFYPAFKLAPGRLTLLV